MRRYQLYLITVIGLLAIAPFCLAQANKQSKQPARKSQIRRSKIATSKIVGTWRLVSDEFRRPNGEVIPFPDLGPNVRGLLIYDPAGYMAVHIVNMERPNFVGIRNVPCDDLKAALRGYRGYFGTYEVNERAGYIT
ncbi:MAG: lipocalin-like domain-containing protein, partial [Pyrinomonadaceae bacterium]